MNNQALHKSSKHALIFNSFSSQMNKYRAVDKIIALLPLSREEAHDLTDQTPIILLDGMTRTEAERLKKYFESPGCEFTLTEDAAAQKRCFRILWPNRPNLDFKKAEAKLGGSKKSGLVEQEKIREKIKQLSKSAQGRQESDSSSSNEELEAAKETIQSLETEKVRLETLLKSEKLDSRDATVSEKDWKDKEEAWNKEKKALESKQEEIRAEWTKKVEKLKQGSGVDGKVQSELEARQTEISKLQKELNVSKEQLGEARKIAADSDEAIRVVQDEKQRLSKTFTETKGKVEANAKSAASHKEEGEGFYRELTQVQDKLAQTENRIAAMKTEKEHAVLEATRIQGLLDDTKNTLGDTQKELMLTRDIETDTKQQLMTVQDALKAFEDTKQNLQQRLDNLSKEVTHETGQSASLTEELTRVKDDLSWSRTEISRFGALEKDLQKKLQDAADLIKKQEVELQDISAREEEKDTNVTRLDDELAQVVDEKNRFVDELKVKSELLEINEVELCTIQDELAVIKSNHIDSQEEGAALKSQLEKSQSSLFNVSEEKAQEKEMAEQELKQNSELINKQAEGLRQSSSENIELEKTLDEKKVLIEDQDKEIGELRDYKERYTSTRDKYLEIKETSENRIETLQANLASKENECSELATAIQDSEMQLESLREKLSDLETSYYALQKEESVNREFRNRYEATDKDYSEYKESMELKLKATESALQTAREELAELRNQHTSLASNFESLTSEHEAHVRSSELAIQERDERIDNLDKKRKSQEMQIDSTQKQLKDYMDRLQQQDVVAKRLQISNQIAEKESDLKILVEKQSGIEREMSSQEESIKGILKGQEEVEKDIVHFKQLQKHLLEQTKFKDNKGKEKSKVARTAPEKSLEPQVESSAPPA